VTRSGFGQSVHGGQRLAGDGLALRAVGTVGLECEQAEVDQELAGGLDVLAAELEALGLPGSLDEERTVAGLGELRDGAEGVGDRRSAAGRAAGAVVPRSVRRWSSSTSAVVRTCCSA
jgi:hypothetical protein